jgi:REP element-mobilizing transposase RayT
VVHVTLRSLCTRLRQRRVWAAVRGAVAGMLGRRGFRVVELTLLGNHLHLIVEAEDRHALAEGMRALGTSLARRINRVLLRRGRFFADRYHARILRTPLEVKHALLYVLNNARRHAARGGRRLALAWADPFSSAPSFLGWSRRAPAPERGSNDRSWLSAARTWLLRLGWRRHGLLELAAVPGAG